MQALTATRLAAVVAVVGAMAAALGGTASVAAEPGTAPVADLQRAARSAEWEPGLDVDTRRIVVVGDSILFTRLQAGQRQNMIVPMAHRAVAHHVPGAQVRNLSFPGLSTLHRIDPRGATLRAYINRMLAAPGPPPDTVVVAISSIDINLFPDRSVRSLAPDLIGELRAVERLLANRGINTVFLPPFGINGDMYNELRRRVGPFRDYRFDERVNRYTELLVESDLPMLFERFAGLDRNGDGNADRHFFVANDPLGIWPDDGIHPNALGERVFGDNLANGLLAAFERG